MRQSLAALCGSGGMEDAPDLGSGVERRVGSSPTSRTIFSSTRSGILFTIHRFEADYLQNFPENKNVLR